MAGAKRILLLDIDGTALGDREVNPMVAKVVKEARYDAVWLFTSRPLPAIKTNFLNACLEAEAHEQPYLTAWNTLTHKVVAALEFLGIKIAGVSTNLDHVPGLNSSNLPGSYYQQHIIPYEEAIIIASTGKANRNAIKEAVSAVPCPMPNGFVDDKSQQILGLANHLKTLYPSTELHLDWLDDRESNFAAYEAVRSELPSGTTIKTVPFQSFGRGVTTEASLRESLGAPVLTLQAVADPRPIKGCWAALFGSCASLFGAAAKKSDEKVPLISREA